MDSQACFRALLAPTVLGFCLFTLGCDGDDSDDEGAVSVNPETGGNDTNDPGPAQEVINENFDAWDGGGDRFFTSKPDQQTSPSPYTDHNTVAEIDGHQALVVHNNAEENGENGEYGFATEIQLQLDQQTDMTGEDYRISFDVYIPSVTADKSASVQFAFYETADYTPIYSKWFTDLPADQWVSIESTITTADDSISHSGFEVGTDPMYWIFDVVRIQLVLTGETVAAGEEILFYLDNLVVTNVPAA